MPPRGGTTRGTLGVGIAIALLGASAPPARAKDEKSERGAYIRAHYAKYEQRIPMRDGVHLFTAIYVPNDAAADRTYPLLLVRTPYGLAPYGADRYKEALGPSADYEREGYIFVFQDVRGRYMSEGEFDNMRPHRPGKRGREIDESSDTYDTIEWLLGHVRHHNGRVGLWGLSYPGFYASAGMIDSHPALVAVSPQAPIADWFWDDMHRHGAFVLPLAFNFFSVFGQPRPAPTTERPPDFDHGTADGYAFFLGLGPLSNADARHFQGNVEFWKRFVEHPNYDEFWQARNLLPHLRNVTAAVLTVGGWFDTEDLYGPLKTYRQVERENPKTTNTLVMGPWAHGGWLRTTGEAHGVMGFGFETVTHYREQIELPFFRRHLKGTAERALPEAAMFETGANRWRAFDAWPPPERIATSLWLREGGKLAAEPPDDAGDAADAFVSDPAKPVPYTMEITTGWAKDYMTEDQRFAAWRPDVLVYRGETLDHDLTVAGPLLAELFVSTTETDADWVVKLIDEFPGKLPADATYGPKVTGGYQMLVRGEAIRGRFRESYEHPEPFVPHEPARVAFELQDVLHTFQRGHRIVVQVQSTWFPLIDRNPQRFVPNIFEAAESDFVPATHRVHRSKARPSRIELGVLPRP